MADYILSCVVVVT